MVCLKIIIIRIIFIFGILNALLCIYPDLKLNAAKSKFRFENDIFSTFKLQSQNTPNNLNKTRVVKKKSNI